MKKLLRHILVTFGVAGILLFSACDRPASSVVVPVVLAPPGPVDLGPAKELPALPEDAIAFDLKYRVQTGGPEDIPYHSFWGFGGSRDNTSTPFLRDVRKRTSNMYFLENPLLKLRPWAALEHNNRQALAFYFDLDANGQLDADERILPTKTSGDSVEFITPDFVNALQGGGETLCRVLLRVSFYYGNSEPQCMWSPAALMEGTAAIDGQPARLLIYASSPGGAYDQYGSAYYSLLLGDKNKLQANEYVPREQLSSLICSDGRYFHLSLEGRRSNGLPARAVLVKDTSPTGNLALKLVGSNALKGSFASLYLCGVDDKSVFIHIDNAKDKVSLPEGSYSLNSGTAVYGKSNASDWEVSFTKGPTADVKAAQILELALGEPVLNIRAVEERKRYDRDAPGGGSFKKGTRIYLEPVVTGKNHEVFSRFRQTRSSSAQRSDRPPTVTIVAADGKQVLSKTMEYG